MKRNEIPIDLSGFLGYIAQVDELRRQIEALDAQALRHWLKLLPPPVTHVKKQRWQVIKQKAA